ncbi:MAG: hypothetical protein HY252_11600 [Sphingobacteriales bacterium]|nr:hypothetical protein [Sphingobacteriales bacterium]
MQIIKEVLEVVFPKGLFEWFDLIKAQSDENNVFITLEEKDIPPLTEAIKDKKILARKFHEFTITDFPLRGKRTLITFKRRYWKVEGETNYLKRDILLAFPGTQLEREFAVFLKKDGGRSSGLAHFYRQVSLPPTERI